MRRLLLSLMAVAALSGQAHAWTNYIPFTKTDKSDVTHHLMWVVDDTLITYGNGKDREWRELQYLEDLGALRTALEKSGIEIHTYTTRQFRADMRLWRFAGQPRTTATGGPSTGDGGGYGCAYFFGGYVTGGVVGIAYAPFLRADSTSTHVIIYGQNGIDAGGVYYDSDTSSSYAKMFGMGTSYNISGGGQTGMGNHVGGPPAVFDSCITVASASTDTFFVDTANLAWTFMDLRPVGVSKIVRLFLGPGQTDSIATPRRGTAGSPTDLTDGKLNRLYGAYRIYCTNANYAGTTTPYLDVVPNFAGQPNNSEATGMIMWALTSRYLNLPKIKVAMVLHGLGIFGSNPIWRTRPNTWGGSAGAKDSAQWAWPRASYVDTVLNDMKNTYHVNKVTFTTEPDTLSWLMSNFSDWNSYIKSWGWAKFSPIWACYDSTGPNRSPTGIVNNTPFDSSGFGGNFFRVVGNRNAPSVATIAQKWGIPQSFAYQDSILKRLGLPISKVYIPFGFGNGSANLTYMPIGPFDYTNANLCPAESTMAGFYNAGRTYIVGQEMGGGFASPSGTEASCRVSSTGRRWPFTSDEDYGTVDNHTIHFISGKMLLYSSQGTAGTPATKGPANIIIGGLPGPCIPNGNINLTLMQVFGLQTFRYGNAQPAYWYNRGAADRTTVTAGNAGERNWGGMGKDRVRVIATPIRFWTNVPMGWYEDYYLLQVTLLKPIKALEDIAGHSLIDWSYPEEAATATP